MKVKIKLVTGGQMPEKKTKGAVCYDCYARVSCGSVYIEPNCRLLIALGFCLELPEGYEALIRGRSGLARNGIDEVIGTVDTDYRGELMACVINNSKEKIRIDNGMRICQLAIREVPEIEFECTEVLSNSERGVAGFGSTGV